MEKSKQTKPQRITVAEAFRLVSEIIDAHPGKSRFPDDVTLYASTTMHETDSKHEPKVTEAVEERIDGRTIARASLKASFLDFCKTQGVVPRNLHNPWAVASYKGIEGIEDFRHDIAYEDFECWARPYQPLIQHAQMVSPRLRPQSGDSLTPMIWDICYDLDEKGVKPTALPVMAELKMRADSADPKMKGPLLCSVAGGVKYEDSEGNEQELTSPRLQSRITEWHKRKT